MSRIYHVFDLETGSNRLVRADNQAQAVRHVVKGRFDVAVATQDVLVGLLTEGVGVEEAGTEAPAVVEAPVIELTGAPV